MRSLSPIWAALAVAAHAAQDSRTFAVLRFYGDGPLMEGRVDPIISPGQTSSHVHTINGGSNMGISATGATLLESNCSNSLVEGDNSAYWVPKAYFHDKDAGTVEPVDMYYMNIYYFFEPTDDDVKAFPVGLQMVSGNAQIRTCPDFGGELQTDGGNASNIQPTQWTCPRSGYDPASWPSASESDGSMAGIQDPTNQGAGQGFPFAECDGYASPLRQDLHFPSCYDPSKDLTDYMNNMVFPTIDYATGKQNCPEGFTHVPHLFYEMYWNTPDFKDRWSPNQGYQPFVLANGDLTGCSAHGDFLAAWDTDILQNIIDTCDAGDSGMDQCSGVTVRDKSSTCNIPSPINEAMDGNLTALPGDNPLVGWGVGSSSSVDSNSTASSSISTTVSSDSSSSISSSAAAASTSAAVADGDGSGDADNDGSSVTSTSTSASASAQVTESQSADAWPTATTLDNGEPTGVYDPSEFHHTNPHHHPAETPSAGNWARGEAHAHAHEHVFRHRSQQARYRR